MQRGHDEKTEKTFSSAKYSRGLNRVDERLSGRFDEGPGWDMGDEKHTGTDGEERSTRHMAHEEGGWMYMMPEGFTQDGMIDGAPVWNHKRLGYRLPPAPNDPVEAVRASLRFLEVADRAVTIPMLAFAYLAPLATKLRPAFALWLRASTGSYKSTIAALLMSHFGAFKLHRPPVTWEATPRAIAYYLHDIKDALAWVDGFNPQLTDREMTQQYEKAEYVLRSLGNVQGRARAGQHTRLHSTLPARALLVSTGELFPQGASIIARIVPIEFERLAVDPQGLSVAWADSAARRYGQAMAAYVTWLADRYDTIGAELFERLRDYGGDQGLARSRPAVAMLQVAAGTLADFAADVGAVEAREADDLRQEAGDVLARLGSSMRPEHGGSDDG